MQRYLPQSRAKEQSALRSAKRVRRSFLLPYITRTIPLKPLSEFIILARVGVVFHLSVYPPMQVSAKRYFVGTKCSSRDSAFAKTCR